MNAKEKAVFYAQQNPQPLASLVDKLEGLTEALLFPTELSAEFTGTVEVENGTALASVAKPAKVVVNDGVQDYEVALTFATSTTPDYSASTAGTYVCVGTLGTLPATLKNTGNHKFNLSVVVAEEVVEP